jgi:ABC-type oligopeptide transport system substrate-binding subunit
VRAIYVNMDDPVVGGMSNERVALRRAIALGIDVDTLIKVVYEGQGIAATQIAAPGIAGFDATAKPRVFDPKAAAALLDRFGYDKRDAQGFRLAPGGKPLGLTLTIFTGTAWREIQVLLRRTWTRSACVSISASSRCRTSSRNRRKASSRWSSTVAVRVPTVSSFVPSTDPRRPRRTSRASVTRRTIAHSMSFFARPPSPIASVPHAS